MKTEDIVIGESYAFSRYPNPPEWTACRFVPSRIEATPSHTWDGEPTTAIEVHGTLYGKTVSGGDVPRPARCIPEHLHGRWDDFKAKCRAAHAGHNAQQERLRVEHAAAQRRAALLRDAHGLNAEATYTDGHWRVVLTLAPEEADTVLRRLARDSGGPLT